MLFKTLLIVLLILLVAIILQNYYKKSHNFISNLSSKEITIKHFDSKFKIIKIKNINGSINIESWKEDKIKVEIEKIGSQEQLKNIKVEIKENNDYLEIETKYTFKYPAKANYTIFIPENASSNIFAKTVNGSIKIKNVNGSVEAITVNGYMEIENIKNNVIAKTTNGSVYLVDILGNIDTLSVNGKIKAENIKKSVNAKTTNGKIELKITQFSKNSFIDSSTNTGSIDIYIPKKTIQNIKEEKSFLGKTIHGSIGKEKTNLNLSAAIGNIRIVEI